MEIGKTLYVTDRDAWRAWLAGHYQSEPEIWLIYYLKATGKARIPYTAAVEEALCFGWIDSIVKKVDEQRTAQRFSPRKLGSSYSQTNIERLRRLADESGLDPAFAEAFLNLIIDHVIRSHEAIKRGHGEGPRPL